MPMTLMEAPILPPPHFPKFNPTSAPIAAPLKASLSTPCTLPYSSVTPPLSITFFAHLQASAELLAEEENSKPLTTIPSNMPATIFGPMASPNTKGATSTNNTGPSSEATVFKANGFTLPA